MSVDKFGRHSAKSAKIKLLHGPTSTRGISYTVSGNFDFDNKRLCNVGQPLKDKDGTSKIYVDTTIADTVKDCLKNIGDAYNCGWKRLEFVGDPRASSDAMTFGLFKQEFKSSIKYMNDSLDIMSKTLVSLDARLIKLENQRAV
jgi:hypothetical protein